MYVSIYTYNILICHTTRSQLPQTHKNNPFWCLGMFSFYELQGQRDDLQRGPDRQAAESSRQAPPVAVDAIVVVSRIFLLDFFWGVIFIMIYMMIINFSHLFFPCRLTSSFHFKICFSFQCLEKNPSTFCFHKKMISLPRSSLLSELALNSCWKPWRRCDWWWGWWGWVASKHGWIPVVAWWTLTFSLPLFVVAKGGIRGKIPRIFFVGSIISEFWKRPKKPSPLKWWEFGGRETWDPLVQGNLGWWNFPQAWRPWRNGSNVRRSKASLGDPRISVFGGDFCGEIQKSGGSW